MAEEGAMNLHSATSSNGCTGRSWCASRLLAHLLAGLGSTLLIARPGAAVDSTYQLTDLGPVKKTLDLLYWGINDHGWVLGFHEPLRLDANNPPMLLDGGGH